MEYFEDCSGICGGSVEPLVNLWARLGDNRYSGLGTGLIKISKT